jgi:hypothetical protein
MMVFELIAQLEKLPPTMQVMIDQTSEGMDMFKFAAVQCAAEIGLPNLLGGADEQVALISHQDFGDDD